MIRAWVKAISYFVSDLLQRPVRVFSICLFLLFVGLILDGSLFRLWALHRDSRELEQKISKIQTATKELRMKIKKAKDPQFIEILARDRFELAEEGDLIFVFSDEEEEIRDSRTN